MRSALFATAAAIALAGPAVAAEVTIQTEPGGPPVYSGSTAPTIIIAPTAPPAPRAEMPPPPPGPVAVWMSGHWQWDQEIQGFRWVSGRYVEPPQPRAAYVPGHWLQQPEGWV